MAPYFPPTFLVFKKFSIVSSIFIVIVKACLLAGRCSEECDAKHEFENDCCELVISPIRQDQLLRRGSDVEELVRSAFPADKPLEKHVYVFVYYRRSSNDSHT